jgi:hypothetical protein
MLSSPSQARVQAAHVYGLKVDVWNAQAPYEVLSYSIVIYAMAYICIHQLCICLLVRKRPGEERK